MKYSIQNDGQGTVMIRVFVPESMASSFLEFINQKSKQKTKTPEEIKESSRLKNENYFIQLNERASVLFDESIKEGSSTKTALSATNYKLKAAGFANVSYEITKQILRNLGKFKQKA